MHYFWTQEVGGLWRVHWEKKAEGGVGVGNIGGKFGGVFKVGLEAVCEERANKSGRSKGLSEEAEACCDFYTSGD